MFKISEETLQKTLNYLVNRPYKDVAQIISELSQLERIEDKEEQENK